MTLFSVDAEFDGPVPGLYSMISFAIVRIDDDLQTAFKGLDDARGNAEAFKRIIEQFGLKKPW